MANRRFCNGRQHNYETTGTRSKCSRCGSVQVDLTTRRIEDAGDPQKAFVARRTTLFSLKFANSEPAPEVGFGKARGRR